MIQICHEYRYLDEDERLVVLKKNEKLVLVMMGLLLAHCCFFCAFGFISRAKAPYDTSKLETALRPT